jgi:hypothetical protein
MNSSQNLVANVRISAISGILTNVQISESTQQKEWYKAQLSVAAWLRGQGIHCNLAGYYDPYDILCGTQRIEVKWASFFRWTQHGRKHERRGWRFNIHRHGSLNETRVDLYVLRCEPGEAASILGTSSFHLVFRAPLNRKTIDITPRSLLTRYASHFNSLRYFDGYRKAKAVSNV